MKLANVIFTWFLILQPCLLHMVRGQEENARDQSGLATDDSSSLYSAIQLGLKEDKSFDEAISHIPLDYEITPRDAQALIEALKRLPTKTLLARPFFENKPSALFRIGCFFAESRKKNDDTTTLLATTGIPELLKRYDSIVELNQAENEEDLVLILCVMVMYDTPDIGKRVIDAARKPLAPSCVYWSDLFHNLPGFSADAPKVIEAFRESLPPNPIAGELLAVANHENVMNSKGERLFNSMDGDRFLALQVNNSYQGDLEQTRLAINALQTLDQKRQVELLDQAMRNPLKQVQIHAATIAVNLGYRNGLDKLVNLCQGVDTSYEAQLSLALLDQEKRIPNLSGDPSLLPLAALYRQLQPANKNASPSELSIVEERELKWTLDQKLGHVILTRFEWIDCEGLAPPTVEYALLDRDSLKLLEYMPLEHKEDLYATRAYYEAEARNHLKIIEFPDIASSGYADTTFWLKHWKGDSLSNVQLMKVIETNFIPPNENYAIALALAEKANEKGLVIFDGADSRWYAESNFVSDLTGFDMEINEVLRLHAGRKLLGYPSVEYPVDAKLTQAKTSHSAKNLVTNFERVLAQLPTFPANRQEMLTSPLGSLQENTELYIQALAETQGIPREDAFLEVYEKFLALPKRVNFIARTQLLAPQSFLDVNFLPYIKLLVERNRKEYATEVVDHFKESRSFDFELLQMGHAYYLLGNRNEAQKLLEPAATQTSCFSTYPDSAVILAQIYKELGEANKGQKLLIHWMNWIKSLQAEPAEYRLKDKKLQPIYDKLYRGFLRLFPDSQDKMQQAGLTLPPKPTK